MSRKAASRNILEAIKNSYVNSGFVQDAAETLLGAGASAGYHAPRG